MQNLQTNSSTNAFNEDACPEVSLEIIESYIQILLPAYTVNLGFQSLFASIADVAIVRVVGPYT